MLNRLLHKQVVLCMNNGAVLEGFIAEEDEGFFCMVEMDNSEVIIRKGDISFARLGIRGEMAMEDHCCNLPHQEGSQFGSEGELPFQPEDSQLPPEKEARPRRPLAIIGRKAVQRPNDFSMATPTPLPETDAKYRTPAFVRTTER